MWKEEEAASSIHRAGHVVYQAPVTAADNEAPSFLYAQPPVYAGRDLTVTLTNTLLVSFTSAYAGRELGASGLLLQHSHALIDNVSELHRDQGDHGDRQQHGSHSK